MKNSGSQWINKRSGIQNWRINRPAGIALITVLGVLALLMVLVLGVLSISRNETRASASYASITDVRTLAELPLNLVMGQIRGATSNLGETKTWTSQPGMIRVYGVQAGSYGRAALINGYKLYSSDEMLTGESFTPDAEAVAMSAWHTQRTLFTDLNEPVVKTSSTGGSSVTTPFFPILDAEIFSQGNMEGAKLNGALPGVSTTNPLPMPVRWIYVCRDGQMVTPLSENDGVAQFDASIVTAGNPITGRIAFWTDDESCKVNINTASEGVPWDVPRATSWQDQNWALYLPGQNEFHRFPGHPAMTSLSPILQNFNPAYARQEQQPAAAYNAGGTAPDGRASYTDINYLSRIYQMLPRTNWGETGQSSRGGTARVTVNTGLPIKSERLLASVDEFFYGSNLDSDGRRLQNDPLSSISSENIRQARAFLTAHSRAPETNLFNRPRVALWPLFASDSYRNTKDKLIAFAATSAGQTAAYFRSRPWASDASPGSSQSADDDFNLDQNRSVFTYLQSLTEKPVPGFGTDSFVEKYTSLGRNQLLLQMFDLQRWGVNSWYAEGSSGSIDLSKSYAYVPPRGYMRGGARHEGGLGEASAVPTRISALPNGDPTPAEGLKAFGRWPTVVEVAVVFMASKVKGKTTDLHGESGYFADQPYDNLQKIKDAVVNQEVNFPGSGAGEDDWADHTLEMRPFLVIQPFTPVVGMPPYSANIRYRIEGLENWRVNGNIRMFRPSISTIDNTVRTDRLARDTDENAHMTAYTGLQAIPMLRDPGSSNESTGYAFAGLPINTSSFSNGSFTFPGAASGDDGHEITIKIYSGYGPAPSASDLPLQTIKMRFPTVGVPVPKLWLGAWKDAPLMTLRRRIDRGDFQNEIMRPGDVIRSVVVDSSPASPSGGDYRLIAARPLITADFFKPHPDYFDSSTYECQSLRLASKTHTGHYGHRNLVHPPYLQSTTDHSQHIWQAAGWEWSGNSADVGSTKTYGLLRDVLYWQDCQPAGPVKLDGAYNRDDRPGDWDNGVGRVEDGPYINKPDEGGYDGGSGASGSDDQKYFSRGGYTEDLGKAFSPNRQIASAVAFGSLPSGVYGSASDSTPRGWQTLLFCPNPASRTTNATGTPTANDHYGFAAPRDHLLLDQFWMPIVEPYAISEPFSTAGKVNMNYQMLPFTNIERSTAVHAALRSVRVRAMPAKLAWVGNSNRTNYRDISTGVEECYKSAGHWMKFETSYAVNASETLKAFERRFDAENDVFRSSSEICDIFLVPKKIEGRTYSPAASANTNPTYETVNRWWNGELNTQLDGMELTGDNTRESPYNQLYPRLTTRSNVFQVHYRVQTLTKARSTSVNTWDDGKDQIAADYRGSAIIERYLDPNTTSLPNFITTLSQPEAAVDDHYRFRIIQRKQFAP